MDDPSPGASSPPSSVDLRSGFCSRTGIFHSLRPPLLLPPSSKPLSIASYMFSSLSPAKSSTLAARPAIVNASMEGASISYGELFSQVLSLALNLRSRFGLSKCERAFILSPASSNIPALYLALLSIGVIVIPSNPASTPGEISRQFELVNPSIAFTTSAEAHKLPLSIPIVLLDSEEFSSLLSNDNIPVSSFPEPEIYQSDIAAALFTSGTTGLVKAALLSHGNFIAVLAGDEQNTAEAGSLQRTFLTVPLFHVFGLTMLLRVIFAGGTMVFLERFDFISMLRAVEKYRVNSMPATPPLMVAMMKSDAGGKFDLLSLERLVCGGAPISKEFAERFAKCFPRIQIIQGYGTTETAGPAASIQGPEECLVYGSAGRMGYDLEARIVDTVSGQSLPPGKHGELWLRGPTIMKGYLGDGEATASTINSEGWLRTGDLCYFNEDGFVFIVDRLKEVIKYKAYQVPPAELELILLSHPQITDAAVIPYPDEEVGEIPMAYVVRRLDSSLSAEEIMNFVAKKVAPYKKVRRVAFIESVPKLASGKILRRKLVDHARKGSIPKL